MKKSIFTIFCLAILTISNAQNQTSTVYTNDMDYVLGDVKQAFITNAITTTAQADNLIEGFKTMNVNGIRIPIYATGVNPNETMYDYFYDEAVAAGFKIFANPAQSSGGARIACGILDGTVCNVKSTTYTNALVTRIKAFAVDYPCDWINPFNEDGAPGGEWYGGQMNDIYSQLDGQINGAELIGPCVWGLPGSISVLQNTTIENNITIASSHNLGFNHSDWSTFIALADASNLPVWDSEVNNNDKFGTGSRLEAALDAGVDGLVLYNSWNTISLTNGSVSTGGQDMMDLYLKFRTDKTYYIDCTGTNKRLANTGSSEDAYGTTTSTTGDNVEWKFVDKGNGYYHIQRDAGGSKPRLRTDGSSFADMNSTGSTGTQTYFDFVSGSASGSYHITAINYSGSNKRLQITSGNDVKMTTTSSTGSWVSFKFTQAGDLSSKSSKKTESVILASELIFPGLINSSNTNFKPITLLENRNNYDLKIYNLSGQLVFSTSDMEQAWIPSGAKKGLFIFKVNYINDQGIQSTKRGKVIVN